MPIRKIISGGQTGADRGGLEAAISAGITHGGWCPRGRKAEDGSVPERYNLRESVRSDYKCRTALNVQQSDASIIFCVGDPWGGTALTIKLCQRFEKPFLLVDLAAVLYQYKTGVPTYQIMHWLRNRSEIGVINIAGPRESKHSGMQEAVESVLKGALNLLEADDD